MLFRNIDCRPSSSDKQAKSSKLVIGEGNGEYAMVRSYIRHELKSAHLLEEQTSSDVSSSSQVSSQRGIRQSRGSLDAFPLKTSKDKSRILGSFPLKKSKDESSILGSFPLRTSDDKSKILGSFPLKTSDGKLTTLDSFPLKISEGSLEVNNPEKFPIQQPVESSTSNAPDSSPFGKSDEKTAEFSGAFPLQKADSPPSTFIMPARDVRGESCRAKEFNQTIRHRGCKSVTIQNYYCVGKCNSFYIPSGNLDDFQVCQSCTPTEYQYAGIILDCPKRRKGFKIKEILIVRQCKCQNIKCLY